MVGPTYLTLGRAGVLPVHHVPAPCRQNKVFYLQCVCRRCRWWGMTCAWCINHRTKRASWRPLTTYWARRSSVPSRWRRSVIGIRRLSPSFIPTLISSSNRPAINRTSTGV